MLVHKIVHLRNWQNLSNRKLQMICWVKRRKLKEWRKMLPLWLFWRRKLLKKRFWFKFWRFGKNFCEKKFKDILVILENRIFFFHFIVKILIWNVNFDFNLIFLKYLQNWFSQKFNWIWKRVYSNFIFF